MKNQISTSNNRSENRQGFTLIEVLVVMAMVVMAAGFAWPSLQKTLRRNQLESAAKQVSTELSLIRIKAIKTGVAQKFRFQPGKGIYEITPCPSGLLEMQQELDLDGDKENQTTLSSSDEEESPFGEENTESDNSTSEADWEEDVVITELPDGVEFAEIEPPANYAEEEINGKEKEVWTDEEGWSRPVFFFPNGQSTGAQIFLEGAPDYSVDVQLRSLTGNASVGEIQKMERDETDEFANLDEDDVTE